MLLVDAHVHIYPCFDLSSFFSSAYRNFRSAAENIPNKGNFLPIIILADWSRQSWFNRFKESADRRWVDNCLNGSGWAFRTTNEEESVQVEGADGGRIIVMAAKKIITLENLEVLALGTTGIFEDGLPLQETLDGVRRHPDSPIPVVSWAVGKWWGRRGKVLEGVMRSSREPFFYLCDNGNRPSFWPRPSHFDLADKLGFRILAGSDPLHFRSDGIRAGRYGCILPARIPTDTPSEAFKAALIASAPPPIKFFGNLESTAKFLQNQIRMQIFKKKWKRDLLK
jgi:hypothetical protein